MTDWIVAGDEFYREYEFDGLLTSGNLSRVQIRLRCQAITPYLIQTFIGFLVNPFPLPNNMFLFAYLGTADESEGYFVSVEASSVGSDGVFSVANKEGHDNCLKVLLTGKNMVLKILDKKQVLSQFPLDNDIRFRITHAACYEKVKERFQG
jgi:hypothetical protein